MSEPKALPVCKFCNNTGVHACPDVVEPILVWCSHKKCPISELRETAQIERNAAKFWAERVVELSKLYSVEEAK